MISAQKEKTELELVLNAVQNIKSDIANLREEFTRIEGSIIKDRVAAVENALYQNRLLLYTNQLEADLDEDINDLMISKCSKGMKPTCTKKFKEMIAQNLVTLKNSDANKALDEIDSKLVLIEKALDNFKGDICEVCHGNLQKKLTKDKKTFQTLVLSQKLTYKVNPQKFDITEISEKIFEPLASPVRLKILVSLSESKKSYTRLAKLTGLRAGHLVYHVNKLVDAGLVAQEDNKGDYVITAKGMEVITKVSNFEFSL